MSRSRSEHPSCGVFNPTQLSSRFDTVGAPQSGRDGDAPRTMKVRLGGEIPWAYSAKCELSQPTRPGPLDPQQQTICCDAVNSPFVPRSDSCSAANTPCRRLSDRSLRDFGTSTDSCT